MFSTTTPSSISVSSIRESLRVNCSAKGSPLPSVTWYKNGVTMHVINNVTKDEFTSELVIPEFQPADQATYRCVARNMYNDTVETSIKICKLSSYKFSRLSVVRRQVRSKIDFVFLLFCFVATKRMGY